MKRTAGHGFTCMSLPDFRSLPAVLMENPGKRYGSARRPWPPDDIFASKWICRDIRPGLMIVCECAPERNKKGAHLQPLAPVIGNRDWMLSCALACPAPEGQDITRTDNHYTNHKPSRKRFLCSHEVQRVVYPLYYVMSVGYAES